MWLAVVDPIFFGILTLFDTTNTSADITRMGARRRIFNVSSCVTHTVMVVCIGVGAKTCSEFPSVLLHF